MSLDCLKSHIGVQGCSATTPNSGIFINQLPGIELEMIDKIADEQQVDFNGVYDDIQERAVRRFSTDVNNEFKKRYKIKSITQAINIGRDIDTTSTTAAAADYRGFTLELERQNTEFAPSNLQSLHIQTVDLYFSSTDATTIKVFDIDRGTELFTQAVAAPAAIGWQRIDIYTTFTERRIFVCYDSTLLVSVEQDVQLLKNQVNTLQTGHFHTACFSCGEVPTNAELRAGSATIAATIVEADITFGENTFGLSSIFSTICSFDSFVCNNRESFTTSLLYLLGIELTTERIYTARLNAFTVFDNDKAKELRDEFEVKYRGGMIGEIEHEGELSTAVDGVNLNKHDYCLECHDNLTFRDAII